MQEKLEKVFFAKPMQIISYLIWTGNKAAVSAVWIWVIAEVLPGTLLSTYKVFKNVIYPGFGIPDIEICHIFSLYSKLAKILKTISW